MDDDDDEDDDDTQSTDYLSASTGCFPSTNGADDIESLNSSRSSLQQGPPPAALFKNPLLGRQSSTLSQPVQNPIYAGSMSNLSRRFSSTDLQANAEQIPRPTITNYTQNTHGQMKTQVSHFSWGG